MQYIGFFFTISHFFLYIDFFSNTSDFFQYIEFFSSILEHTYIEKDNFIIIRYVAPGERWSQKFQKFFKIFILINKKSGTNDIWPVLYINSIFFLLPVVSRTIITFLFPVLMYNKVK